MARMIALWVCLSIPPQLVFGESDNYQPRAQHQTQSTQNIVQQDTAMLIIALTDTTKLATPKEPQSGYKLAKLSFIFGISSLSFWIPLGIPYLGLFLSLLSIPAIILGIIALKRLKPGEKGRGMAITGIVIGALLLSIVVIGLIVSSLMWRSFSL
jgi:hypothetical protein